MAQRELRVIAEEIRADWKIPYFGAVPYLKAMLTMEKIEDMYFLDSGESIVLYFLGNAASYRGETARRIKAELRGMVECERKKRGTG